MIVSEILATANLEKRETDPGTLPTVSDSFREEPARFPRFTGQNLTWKQTNICLQTKNTSRIKSALGLDNVTLDVR